MTQIMTNMTQNDPGAARPPFQSIEIIEPASAPDVAGEPVAMVVGPMLQSFVGADRVLRLPENLQFGEWDAVGTMLQRATDTVEESAALLRLWRADWYRFGVRKFGEDMATHAREMWGVTGKTLANDAAGTARITPAARTVPGVTFAQLEGANKVADPVKQVEVLTLAVRNGWGRDETELAASGRDPAEWNRERALRRLRLAYHDLDEAGRETARAWFETLLDRAKTAEAVAEATRPGGLPVPTLAEVYPEEAPQ